LTNYCSQAEDHKTADFNYWLLLSFTN